MSGNIRYDAGNFLLLVSFANLVLCSLWHVLIDDCVPFSSRKISNGSSVTRVDEEGREGKGCSQSLIASPDPTPGRALAEVGFYMPRVVFSH